MSLFDKEAAGQRQAHLMKLHRQMQGLRNEMEFVEILTQFWPLPNMAARMERLEERLHLLNQQASRMQVQAG